MYKGDTATREGQLPKDATPGHMTSKIYQGDSWPVRGLVGHRVNTDEIVKLHVDWEESYDPKWEPRCITP